MTLKNGVVLGLALVVAITGGCAKKAELAMKFEPSQTATYKVATESIKDYNFEQPSINQSKKQQTINGSEVVFDQTVQSVDAQGVATILVTIKGASYTAKNPTGEGMQYDSSKADSGMAKLIGQSYTLKIAPDGNVAAIENTQAAKAAVAGDNQEAKVAQSLLTDEAIKARHSVPLPKNKAELKKGKSWSVLKGSPAGMLVPKSYEKVYTLEEVKKDDGKEVAIVKMEARPSSTKAADVQGESAKGMGFFEKMFDAKESYKGELVMDGANGSVINYHETLKSEWVATEPSEEVKSDKGPDILTMGFTYKYSIEKI